MAYLVFDTSVLSRLLSGDKKVFKVLEVAGSHQYIVPLAVDAELRYGFKFGSREAQNLDVYTNFMSEFNFRLTTPDQSTSLIYADLAAHARKHGVAVTANDLWIAATAIQYGARLLTFDVDFSRIPQVRLYPIQS